MVSPVVGPNTLGQQEGQPPHLTVYVDPKDEALRQWTQQAIELWKAAVGADWLVLTDTPAANVHVTRDSLPKEDGGLAQVGSPNDNTLWVKINSDLLHGDFGGGSHNQTWANMQMPQIVAHELGHSLGLSHDDPNQNGLMAPGMGESTNGAANAAPNLTEVNKVLQAYGLGPSHQVQGDIAPPHGVISPAYPWQDWEKQYNANAEPGNSVDLAARLVTTGLSARAGQGLDLSHYDQSQWYRDVLTMARALHTTNNTQTFTIKSGGKAYVGETVVGQQRVVRKTPSQKTGGGVAGSNKRVE